MHLTQTWDPGPPLEWKAGRSSSPLRRLSVVAANILFGFTMLLLVVALCLLATGTRPHVEASESMAPMLRTGDLVLLRPQPAWQSKPGQVVGIRENSGRRRVILHRVTRVIQLPGGRVEVHTRGDANATGERWRVSSQQKVGRHVGHVPQLGRVANVLRDPRFSFALALLVAALGVTSLVRTLRPR